MLLIVFGETRARDQRLKVLRALTENIVLAQQQGGMMDESLGELQRLTKSRAAWFRLIEGGHLVATHAVGVSTDFLREAGFAQLTEDVSQMMERGRAVTAPANEAGSGGSGSAGAGKAAYVVMVPVLGKKSSIGLLMLGSAAPRKLTAEELEFSGDLRTAAGDCDREFPVARAGAALAAAVAQHV